MNTTALAGQLAELLAAGLVPVVLYVLALLRRWHINTTVLRAIVRGAGAAYMSLLEEGEGATKGAVERAVDAGVAYVEERVPQFLPKAGFGTTGAVRDAVRAQLGLELASDPRVSIGGPR
jgi:hypothetical protein